MRSSPKKWKLFSQCALLNHCRNWPTFLSTIRLRMSFRVVSEFEYSFLNSVSCSFLIFCIPVFHPEKVKNVTESWSEKEANPPLVFHVVHKDEEIRACAKKGETKKRNVEKSPLPKVRKKKEHNLWNDRETRCEWHPFKVNLQKQRRKKPSSDRLLVPII